MHGMIMTKLVLLALQKIFQRNRITNFVMVAFVLALPFAMAASPIVDLVRN
jgi:hypothetical protein